MNLSRLKPLTNNVEFWKAFTELLEERITDAHKSLEQQSDSVSLYRAQGRVEALRKLLRLRDDVNG